MQNECNKTKGFVVPQIPQSHTLQTHANEFKGYANYSILPVRTKGRITMSTNKEIELNDTMYDCYTELEKAIFAIVASQNFCQKFSFYLSHVFGK